MSPANIRSSTRGVVLAMALSLAAAASANEAPSSSPTAEGDFLVVVWNYSSRSVYGVDRTQLKSRLVSQKGLQPDGTRPWSVANIIVGKEARMQRAPYANAAEYRALAGVFWKYYSPDGRFVLVGHGHENDNASIESVDLVDVAAGTVVASIRFGKKRFISDMLWLPDSRSAVLLDHDSYVGSIKDALTFFIGHGSWTSDLYAHVVDAETGRVDRIDIARRLPSPSAALALPGAVVH